MPEREPAYITLAAAAIALTVSQDRVYRLAQQHGWRTRRDTTPNRRGQYATLYRFEDVLTTYNLRKGTK